MGRQQTIHRLVAEAAAWAINVRRDLHRWPELGNEEYQTSQRVKDELEQMGIPVSRMLETGLVAVIHQEETKKVVALRADMDALPIQEGVPLPYASLRKGLMHACGHDVHTAVLLGVARVLSQLKEELNGSVKFIFQPAEETDGGAERMIQNGCLENPKVDFVLGCHVKPDLPAGMIGLKYGKVHASSDTFRITIKGKGGHGAYPEEGIDAVAVAAQLVVHAQSIVSRNTSPLNPAVISFGRVSGGTGKNIIADQVILEGTLRALDQQSREFLKTRLRQVAKYTAKAALASAQIEFTKGYPALVNDNLMVDLIKDVAMCEPAIEKVIELKEPSMGVEDFSFFLERVPGAFFFLGSGYKGMENAGIHSGQFEVDESCIKTGILLETLAVLKLLE